MSGTRNASVSRWEEELNPTPATSGLFIDDEETTEIDHMGTSLAVTYHPKPAPQQFNNKGTVRKAYII
jgi:hypothetical protein